MTTIATARLTLRPLAESDADTLIRELNNLAISRWAARIPHPYGPADAAEFLGSSRTAAPDVLRLAIDHEGQMIGGIGIEHGEIGYWIAESRWGQGFATEAARAVTDHAFETTGREAIRASYQLGNAASRKILLGLGFRERGESMSFCRATNMATAIMTLELAKADWAQARERRR